MSKLLNMLMNLNRSPGNGEVIPDLLNNVRKSSAERRSRREYVICGTVIICAILAGAAVMFYLERGSRLRQKDHQSAPVAAAPRKEAVSALPVRPPAQNDSEPHGTDKPVGRTDVTNTRGVESSKLIITAPANRKSPVLKSDVAIKGTHNSEQKTVNTSPHKANDSPPVAAPTPAVAKQPPADPESRDSWLISARSAEKRKAYSEAARMYKKALTYDRENYLLMNNITSMYIRLGDYAAALDMAGKTLVLDQGYVPALINQGIARNAVGNFSGASESFTKALELDPANRDAMYNFGLFYEKNGKLDAAAQVFKRLGDSGDMQGMIGLARIYEKQARTNDAVRIYVEIATMRDVPADARNSVIVRLRQLGN